MLVDCLQKGRKVHISRADIFQESMPLNRVTQGVCRGQIQKCFLYVTYVNLMFVHLYISPSILKGIEI